jgi:uncharacterized protein (TIGR01777 family)
MKIVIAGGKGFLGTALYRYFKEKGDEVWVLSRNPKHANEHYWDGKTLGKWQEVLEGAAVLINLAGKSVNCRYTVANKAAILASRIDATHILQEAVLKQQSPPRIWINASSATTYIHASTQKMDEFDGIIGDDFSMNICKQWEQAFFKDNTLNIRKVAARTAIVLGNEGGALPHLKTLVQCYLGGRQADGKQMVSWIHIEDFCRAIDFIIQDEGLYGPVNVTAPIAITNEVFMAALRKRYKKRYGLNQSKWMLELGAALIGTETEMLLKSRWVYPEKLLLQQFVFKYPKLKSALNHL